jgi:PKD repeat protein
LVSPSFTYTQSGPRTVGLRVTDQQGASDTAEVTITVQNTPPSVNITSPSEGATFATGADIPITAAASDSDGSVQKVEFFRDGVKLGEDQVAPYSYQWSGAASGSHTLTAKATDNRGAPTTSGPVHITVSSAPQPNRPPTAVATGAPTSGVAPLTVSFNGAGSSDPDPGDGLAYAWDLDGDGAFDDSSSAAPSFTYSAAGSYLVRLRVTDEDGASAMAELRIDVGSNSPSPSPITPPSPPPITPPSNPWDLNPPLETDTRDPSVSHFALVPKRFRVASRGTARGSRLRFRLSEPAGVRIVIERARVGRKVDERCEPARRPRCHHP